MSNSDFLNRFYCKELESARSKSVCRINLNKGTVVLIIGGMISSRMNVAEALYTTDGKWLLVGYDAFYPKRFLFELLTFY